MFEYEEWQWLCYGWGFGFPTPCATCRRTPANQEVYGKDYCVRCAPVARGERAWCPNCKRGIDKNKQKCILCKGEGTLEYA